MKYIDMVIHVLQVKSILLNNNIPLILLFERLCKIEDVPNPIPNHMLTVLILVELGGNLWISLSINTVKVFRALILGTCFFYITLLIGGL